MSLNELKEIVAAAYRETDYAISLEAILEIGNSQPLPAAFTETHAGYVLIRVRHSLVTSFALSLTRLHDHFDHDRACLIRAFALLNRPEVSFALANTEGERLRAHYGEPDQQIETLQLTWREVKRRIRLPLETLRRYRDAFIAHNLIDIPDDLPTYGQLFTLLAETRPVVEALARVTGVNINSFNGLPEIWNRRAEEFWSCLVRGSAPREQP